MGLAIVLTILFGSLGLFYASVTGGLVMTFAVPLAVMLLAVLGVGAGGLEGMILFGGGGLLLWLLFGWIISIVWVCVSVHNYNKALYEKYEND